MIPAILRLLFYGMCAFAVAAQANACAPRRSTRQFVRNRPTQNECDKTVGKARGAGPHTGCEARERAKVDAIKREMLQRYPKPRNDSPDLFWFDAKTLVTTLEAPVLEKCLPATRFYATMLECRVNEYPRVETLVAVTVARGKLKIIECLSPGLITESQEFLRMFRGLKTASAKDRKCLGQAIAELFPPVCYRGELRNGRLEQSRYVAELWVFGQYWRHIGVMFDRSGALSEVSVYDGVNELKSDEK